MYLLLISIKFDTIIFSKSILFLISYSFILYSLYIFGDKYKLKNNKNKIDIKVKKNKALIIAFVFNP